MLFILCLVGACVVHCEPYFKTLPLSASQIFVEEPMRDYMVEVVIGETADVALDTKSEVHWKKLYHAHHEWGA
ncbi:hypothetical protein DOY81_002577 [Sarcophaga bullata]|nr:hypothetical protein DOY81_002577 [Sarcophaga bullata]